MSNSTEINLSLHKYYRTQSYLEGDIAYLNSLGGNDDLHPYYSIIPNMSGKHYSKSTNNSEYYSRKYSKVFMICYVITVDPISYQENNANYKVLFYDILLQYFIKSNLFGLFSDPIEIPNIFVVCQSANSRGLHAHVCILKFTPFSKDDISNYDNYFLNRDITVIPEDSSKEHKTYTINATFQKIKSACSYINYLQSEDKGLFNVICSNYEMCELFRNFSRHVIFPSGSEPKRQKRVANMTINSNNELVIFFMKKLHNNIMSYNEVMNDNNSHAFLHISNLKAIWENCVTQFRASMTHEKNLIAIYNNIIEESLKNPLCCCALLDLLELQNINPDEFGKSLTIWLIGTSWQQKRNAFLLQGPPDSGKSFLARLLWNFFYCKERIVNDGLFSFANAPGAGCLLWEEPHISPELADTTKLILEGNPSVSVAVKNKSTQCMNKRVPIIITTNKNLGVYAMDAQGAFDARCFKFEFKNIVPPTCTSKLHKCPYVHLDKENSTQDIHETVNQEGEEHSGLQETGIVDCTNFHTLTERSILSFIALSINNNQPEIELFKNNYSKDYKRIFTKVADINNYCNCTLHSIDL